MATLTTNINYLQPTGFKIVMDRKHFPNLTFFATSVLHPNMTIGYADIPYRRANIHMPGDKLTFGELTCNIIMDENMEAYQEMYNWMEALVETSQVKPTDRTIVKRPTSADISVVTLTSANTKVKELKYYDAIPTLLGDVSFETIAGDQYLTFPVGFTFSYFAIV